MISNKMQEAINAQINAEMWSAYLYLSMSMEAADNDMKGIAHWFRKQFNEEMEHAMKFVDYLHSQMARVELKAIDAVPTKWDGCPVKMFEQTLEHEKKVTSLIHNLYEMAVKEKDYATSIMLQWFVNEQVEEEANAQEILNTLKCIGKEKTAFFLYDKELGKR